VTTRRHFIVASSAALVGSSLGGCRRGAAVAPAPVAVPATAELDLVSHVLSRCSFGARPEDRGEIAAMAADPETAIRAWLESQLEPERIEDRAASRAARRFPSLELPAGDLYEFRRRVLLQDLTSATLLRAVLSRRQLQEVMVELWSDHFNIDISKGDCAWLKVADDREVIRRHAMGRFPELLRASALSPAMLWYLDGRVNRRGEPGERPNENYARELLELHTLGVHAGYTQRDVMEVARCLTGWTVRPRDGFRKAAVVFRPELHDDGPKLVLGQPIPGGLGAEDLERVLGIVASHGATARHVASKLCRRFIAGAPAPAAVDAVAAAFTRSGGDVRACLRAVFDREEFLHQPARRGARMKRPFHLVVSALRATGATTDGGAELSAHLLAMGQAPFQCPTPDGYPDAPEAWRDGLLPRWRFAAALAGNRIPGTRVDAAGLLRRVGGEEALMAHLLGRLPAEPERSAWRAVGGGSAGLAMLLGAPAFQVA